MRLQVHQLLLREVQDLQEDHENVRVQMNAQIRSNLEPKSTLVRFERRNFV